MIKEIVQGNSGCSQKGLCSVCSASDYVIEAMIRRAKETGTVALIECTANQVNQFGGYTGMRPKDFADKVYAIADRLHLSRDRLILGGDHLGPFPWRGEDEDAAMSKAEDLVAEYVDAGFSKIHIDTSMRLGDDAEDDGFGDVIIAGRASRLAWTAMLSRQIDREYVFVLGSEVPTPGGVGGVESAEGSGASGAAGGDGQTGGIGEAAMSGGAGGTSGVGVTPPGAFRQSYECFREIFLHQGLKEIWKDVVAFVVQPGVEFGEMHIDHYDRGRASELCGVLAGYPDICFEGHSTDYQPKTLLREMVEDGIRILKVGPALTFYQREAVFALEMIERELFGSGKAGPSGEKLGVAGSDATEPAAEEPDAARSGAAEPSATELSNFAETLEGAMLKDPSHWKNYYHGDEGRQRFLRKFSLSDRSRYYFPQKEVAGSLGALIRNLDSVEIPYSLLSQYMPIQAELVKAGAIRPDAESLIISRITDCIDDYLYAVMY